MPPGRSRTGRRLEIRGRAVRRPVEGEGGNAWDQAVARTGKAAPCRGRDRAPAHHGCPGAVRVSCLRRATAFSFGSRRIMCGPSDSGQCEPRRASGVRQRIFRVVRLHEPLRCGQPPSLGDEFGRFVAAHGGRRRSSRVRRRRRGSRTCSGWVATRLFPGVGSRVPHAMDRKAGVRESDGVREDAGRLRDRGHSPVTGPGELGPGRSKPPNSPTTRRSRGHGPPHDGFL